MTEMSGATMAARGIDDDLWGCLDANPQPFTMDQIVRVLAVVEGEHDGDSYHWVIELSDGRFAYLKGWCDYTGWDCQSDAESTFAETAQAVVQNTEEPAVVKDALLTQITEGKRTTWREATGVELGVTDGGD